MPDLAFGDQLLDGSGDVLNRYIGIDTVLVQEVDIVSFQSLEHGVDLHGILTHPAQ